MPAEIDGWIPIEQIFFSPAEDVEMRSVVVKNLFCCSFVSDFCSSLSSSSCLPTVFVNLPKTDTRVMVFLALRKKKKSQYNSNPAEVITAKGREDV